MGITTKIQIANNAWTLIAASGSGFITNEELDPVLVCVATVLPAPESRIGHTLGYSGYSPDNYVNYSLATGENVYALALHKATQDIMVTPNG